MRNVNKSLYLTLREGKKEEKKIRITEIRFSSLNPLLYRFRLNEISDIFLAEIIEKQINLFAITLAGGVFFHFTLSN